MAIPAENLKNQSEGHGDSFLSVLGAPARRALENKGITTLQQLSGFTEKEILSLHGIGPLSMPKLREALAAGGLSFRPKS